MITDAHKIYAYITDKLVQAVHVDPTYTVADTTAKELYGNNTFVIQCNRYRVKPGDLYIDNKFYRKNENDELEELLYMPSQLDILSELQEDSYKIAKSIAQMKEK